MHTTEEKVTHNRVESILDNLTKKAELDRAQRILTGE